MALARTYARDNPGERWCVRNDVKEWARGSRRFMYPTLFCFRDDPNAARSIDLGEIRIPKRRTTRNARQTGRGGKRRISHKSLKKLAKKAEAQGWIVTFTKGGHLQFIPPDPDKSIVTTSSTPSDHRAIKNIESALRRSGLRPNPLYEQMGEQLPLKYGADSPPFAIGDTLVLERKPIYATRKRARYHETRKRLRTLNVGTDAQGEPLYTVRLFGSSRGFRLHRNWSDAWILYSGPPHPLRYEVVEYEIP